jgi:hypothetical protein
MRHAIPVASFIVDGFYFRGLAGAKEASFASLDKPLSRLHDAATSRHPARNPPPQ